MSYLKIIAWSLFFATLVACGNNASDTNNSGASGSSTGVQQAAADDYDGLIKELTQLNKKVNELAPKATAGDVSAAQQMSDLGMRALSITTSLMEASSAGKLSQAQMEAWAKSSDPNAQ